MTLASTVIKKSPIQDFFHINLFAIKFDLVEDQCQPNFVALISPMMHIKAQGLIPEKNMGMIANFVM